MSTPETEAKLQSSNSPERIVCVLSSGPHDDIDLRLVWNALVRDRWIVIMMSLLVMAAATSYAWFAPSWSRAEVDLLPEYSAGALPGSESSLVDVPASVAERKQLLAVLRSREFARGFLLDEGLVEKVSAVAGVQKDVETAVSVFAGGISSIREDPDTRLVILGIEWTDAATAAAVANRMAARINRVFREKAISEATSSVESLKGQMTQNQDPALQQVINRLLEDEYRKLALARARDDLAVRIVDPAHPAASARAPNRRMTAAAGLVGGFVLGLMVVFARSVSRRTANAGISSK